MLGKHTCYFYLHLPCAHPPPLPNVAFQILDLRISPVVVMETLKMLSLNQMNTCFHGLPLLRLSFLSHLPLSCLSQDEDHREKGGFGFCPKKPMAIVNR